MDFKGKFAILNGPNLNLLGIREPEIYGYTTLADVISKCERILQKAGYQLDFRQTNSEGELIDWVQELTNCSAIIINPAGYTHTSVALRDAIMVCNCPVIEVHISNIFGREPFRHKSLISQVASGVVCGFGTNSYIIAASAGLQLLETG